MIASLVLVFVDHRYNALSEVRYQIARFLKPVTLVSDVPQQVAGWGELNLRSRDSLIQEIKVLRAQSLKLNRRLQKVASLSAENVRLRELLNSSKLVDEKVLIAEVVALDADPFRHKVQINKGFDDGVREGQPVLDARGLMGQVEKAGPNTAWVLLISDTSHAMPVQVNRNGVRAIAVGSGQLDKLWLLHVPNTADIEPEDLLVSSGLGGRFPAGYPVATVDSVVYDPGEPFALIEATPESHLDRGRYLLVVMASEESDSEAASSLSLSRSP